MADDAVRGAPRSHRNGGPVAARPFGVPPDVTRVRRMLEPVLAAMDLDLEDVRISSAGRRRVLRVVVDGDCGVNLDEMAEVSREVSARLDSGDAMGDSPYTLEVSSPGVDRPLTSPRHWRRAAGRLVTVRPAAGEAGEQRSSAETAPAITGRVLGADEAGVALEVDGQRQTFGYGELGPGRVQVEFGHLDDDGGDADAGLEEDEPDGY